MIRPVLVTGIFVLAGCGSSIGHERGRDGTGAVGGTGPGAGGNVGVGGTGAGDGSGGRAASGGSATGGTSGTTAGNAGTAGTSGSAGAPDDPDASSVVLDGTPLYTRVQRLTVSQWEHAVTDILGFGASRNLSQNFQRPTRGVTDFDNNEKVLFVDATTFRDFETGAEAAATLATADTAALAAVYAGDDVTGFVQALGRRAFRRPLTDAEATAYAGIFARGEELYGSGFAHGAALVIRGLLQSPHFLYRTELGPAGEALNSYELASKLSFLLLDTTPSDALLDAAAAGELDSDEGLEAAARQMLETPAAASVLRDFHRQLFAIDDYASLDKTGVPEFDPAVLPELDAASTAFFDRILQDGLGLREIFTSSEAYVGAGLAPFYGLSVPASGLELREVGPSRSGYFMQVPFLMLGAVGARSDAGLRGAGVGRLLCGPLGISTDPLGVALENFDGLGRQNDDGQSVKTDGSYPFAEGVREFGDGNELMRILADSMQAHTCYSKKVSGYALGRDMAAGDRPLLEGLGQVSLSHPLSDIVLALIRDPAFRSRPQVAP